MRNYFRVITPDMGVYTENPVPFSLGLYLNVSQNQHQLGKTFAKAHRAELCSLDQAVYPVP
jgi:hypothetical protein